MDAWLWLDTLGDTYKTLGICWKSRIHWDLDSIGSWRVYRSSDENSFFKSSRERFKSSFKIIHWRKRKSLNENTFLIQQIVSCIWWKGRFCISNGQGVGIWPYQIISYSMPKLLRIAMRCCDSRASGQTFSRVIIYFFSKRFFLESQCKIINFLLVWSSFSLSLSLVF